MESFIPKHYSEYADLNVRCCNGCKECAPGNSNFLRYRLKKIVEIFLDKICKVTDDTAVRSLGNATFTVESVE